MDSLDKTDLQILRILQDNSRLTTKELAAFGRNIFNCSLSFILISFPGIPPGRFYFSSLYKIPLYGFPVSTLFFIKCLYIPRFSASI